MKKTYQNPRTSIVCALTKFDVLQIIVHVSGTAGVGGPVEGNPPPEADSKGQNFWSI